MIYRSKRRLITSIGSNLLSNKPFSAAGRKDRIGCRIAEKKTGFAGMHRWGLVQTCVILYILYIYPISIGRGWNEPDLGQCTSTADCMTDNKNNNNNNKTHAFGSTQPVCILEQIPGNLLVIVMEKRNGRFDRFAYIVVQFGLQSLQCECEFVIFIYIKYECYR